MTLKRVAAILLALALFIALVLAFTAALNWALMSRAEAHSWYDPWCCDTTDCHAQRPGEFVKLTAAGWQVDVPQFAIHELVGFDDPRLRNTPMDAATPFHICIFAKALRCFYRPGAAG